MWLMKTHGEHRDTRTLDQRSVHLRSRKIEHAPSRPRLLVVPGLHNSGAAHWQSWLQAQHRGAVRVEQDDWATPDLDRWAQRIADTLQQHRARHWVVAAHSFGCLALVRHLHLNPDSAVAAGLLVAPADPDKFGVVRLVDGASLSCPTTLVASDTDPWMRVATARRWARRWGSHWINLGDAGHINTEAGFGPLPLAQHWVTSVTHLLDGAAPVPVTLLGHTQPRKPAYVASDLA
jgi:predicted alpha/beta hydrolase family esterase